MVDLLLVHRIVIDSNYAWPSFFGAISYLLILMEEYHFQSSKMEICQGCFPQSSLHFPSIQAEFYVPDPRCQIKLYHVVIIV